MTEEIIVQNMILRDGQSQHERMPEALDVHFVDVEERSSEDLLRFTTKFARFVNYYRNRPDLVDGDWASFWPEDESKIEELVANRRGNTPAHLALFLSFLELYDQPKAIINRLTARHLDFQFRDILRLKPRDPVPDHVHLIAQLKKNASPILIEPAHQFSAGKDAAGVDLIYVPTRETVVGQSAVESVRSVFFDKTAHGSVYFAPIANSADGLGGELDEADPKWSGFGHVDLPHAVVGFALASPVLRMQEGNREVTVELQLTADASSDLHEDALHDAFNVLVTGEKGWIGPIQVGKASLSDLKVLSLTFTISADEKPVVDYSAERHGDQYRSDAPIVQVLLRHDAPNIGYNSLSRVSLKSVNITVVVKDVTTLRLENDEGTLDSTKAFRPFGSQPKKGFRFMVGCTEALSKRLSNLTLRLAWNDVPDFETHYGLYSETVASQSHFTAGVAFQDGGSWIQQSPGVRLFGEPPDSSDGVFDFTSSPDSVTIRLTDVKNVLALQQVEAQWADHMANTIVQGKTVFSSEVPVSEPSAEFVTFSLETDFLHEDYRKETVSNLMQYAKSTVGDPDLGPTILNEPYTPTAQKITLDYTASTGAVQIESTSLEEFAKDDVHFYHISYFGQMREHAFQRSQFDFLVDKRVSLVSRLEHEGEVLLGFRDLKAGDSVSVLFQMAEGSADPDAARQSVEWFVLCDNYWKRLSSSEVVLDTTNQLLTSGVITFVVPKQATTINTLLPADRLWIKGAVTSNVTAVSQFIDIVSNAFEVKFVDQGNDSSHLVTSLPNRSITKLKKPISAVKSIKQPYASFGGMPAESDENFHTRTAERLRHKNRGVSSWDYERIILNAFPRVHKVKCIPHAKPGSWFAPGNVLIIVVPDLRNQNAVDPLQPKVDSDTTSKIKQHLRERVGMGVNIEVENPSYQQIKLDFKVQFKNGYEFNFYSEQIKGELTRLLSPWAYDTDRDITFGGNVYKSMILDHVEELEYVEYVTDFKMFSQVGDTHGDTDLSVMRPDAPDTILVSARSHTVNEAA